MMFTIIDSGGNYDTVNLNNTISIDEYVDYIRCDELKNVVLEIRSNKNKGINVSEAKFNSLPLIYFYGKLNNGTINQDIRFNTIINLTRNFNDLDRWYIDKKWVYFEDYNGFIVIDIDNLSDVESTKNKLKSLNWVKICHRSVTNGLRVLIETDNKNKDLINRYYWDVKRGLKSLFDINVDDDVMSNRICFYSSWDPDIYYNKDADKYIIK